MSFPPSILRSPPCGSQRALASRSSAHFSARSIRHGWPRAKIPSTRSRTNKRRGWDAVVARWSFFFSDEAFRSHRDQGRNGFPGYRRRLRLERFKPPDEEAVFGPLSVDDQEG